MVLLSIRPYNDIRARIETGDQLRDLAGRVLKVVVHCDDLVAIRLGQTTHESCKLPGVLSEIDSDNVRSRRGETLNDRPGENVRRVIVHQDYLVSVMGEGAGYLLHEVGQPPPRAIARDHHRILWKTGHYRGC